MTSRIDIYRALGAFTQAAELGSFHQAAVKLGTSPQAVSKSIRQLEQHLGVRLFHRTTHKSRLTEEGERLYESSRLHVSGLASSLSGIRQVASDDEGPLRIAAPSGIGRRLLIPLLAEYQTLYPRIEAELLLEDGFTDLVAARIDVGFRAGLSPDGQIVSRQLFPLPLIVCASPDYLSRHGWPQTPDELLEHRCCGFRHPGTGRIFPWEFLIDGEIVFRDIPSIFRTNDGEAEFLATLQGIAIGLLDAVTADQPLREGRLVPLLCQHISTRMGLHIYYPQRTDMPRRIRNFIDFAIARLGQTPAYPLGNEELAELHARGTRLKASHL